MADQPEENAGTWLLDAERRAILPIKWLLFGLCAGLVYVNSPGGIPHRDLFLCLLFFLVTNLFFSYLIYGKRITSREIQRVSYASYACDVVAIAIFVYLVGRLLEVERGTSGEFYVLFFLVILRGSLCFRSMQVNLLTNMVIGILFVTTYALTYHRRFTSQTEFFSRILILSGVMALSWFLMEVLASQRRRMLQINENLRLERQYVERLFESITDGVIAIDPDLRITAINDAAREALALESKEGPNAYPVGGDVLLLPRQIAEAVTLTLEESLRYTNHVMEVTRRDGESITLRFSTRTIRTPEGELEGIVAIFEDISVLRRLEDQMIRSEKLASVGELAAGIAHELGNPMGIIRSCAGYLKEKWKELGEIPRESPEKAVLNEEMDVILGESERCQGLLKRLLSLSSRSEPEIKDVPVRDAIEKAVSLIRYQKEAEGIDFQVVCDESAASWRADPSLVEQALINILLNAIQAMDGKGKVEIRTSARTRGTPGIPTEGPLHWVQVEVEDEGCGIPPEHLDQVFDPFFTTREGGTGLGLSITHRIVERMSGQIAVRSGKEKGTCVTFALPAGSAQKSE